MRIYKPEELPPPGPLWEPVVYDGKYPAQDGDTGDIYINRYKDPPLYYVFYCRSNSQLVSREEIKEWVTGGLMRLPTPDQSKPPISPGQKSSPAWSSHIGKVGQY